MPCAREARGARILLLSSARNGNKKLEDTKNWILQWTASQKFDCIQVISDSFSTMAGLKDKKISLSSPTFRMLEHLITCYKGNT